MFPSFLIPFKSRTVLIAIALAFAAGAWTSWASHTAISSTVQKVRSYFGDREAVRIDIEVGKRDDKRREVSHDIDTAIHESNLPGYLDPEFECMWRAIRQGRPAACRVPAEVPRP